jgi:hypothetical protein
VTHLTVLNTLCRTVCQFPRRGGPLYEATGENRVNQWTGCSIQWNGPSLCFLCLAMFRMSVIHFLSSSHPVVTGKGGGGGQGLGCRSRLPGVLQPAPQSPGSDHFHEHSVAGPNARWVVCHARNHKLKCTRKIVYIYPQFHTGGAGPVQARRTPLLSPCASGAS